MEESKWSDVEIRRLLRPKTERNGAASVCVLGLLSAEPHGEQ